MLLNKAELDAILSGEVSLIFRRWRRPSVKAGGTLKTAIGVLAIDSLTAVDRADISSRDAVAAGHDSLEALLHRLDGREGTIYRIQVRYAGADPRIAMREDDRLTDDEFEHILKKLRRMDSSSRTGAWTSRVLGLIARHPMLAAGSLAEKAGVEKQWLKLHVRKLKNLGLTISHQPGYELSPRGKAVLKRLARDY